MNLVLGMPRSRTAWMAAYLTFGCNHFQHEAFATNKCKTIDDYKKAIKEGNFCDSTTMGKMLFERFGYQWDEILSESQVLVIHNDIDTVIESWKDLLFEERLIELEDNDVELHRLITKDCSNWLNTVKDKAYMFKSVHVEDLKGEGADEAMKSCFQYFHGRLPPGHHHDLFSKLRIERLNPLDIVDESYIRDVFV